MKKITLAELAKMGIAAKPGLWSQARKIGRDVKLYLHWSAGHYGQFFDDYHVNIDKDGALYVSTADLSEIKSHTYKRNSGSVGLAMACAYQATRNDLGPEAPTDQQIESMAQSIAVLCKSLDLTVDLQRVMTHAEAADNKDGYNPGYEANGYPDGMYGPEHSCERWDLAILKKGDAWCSGGNVLRGKAIWYQNHGKLP